MTLDQKKPHHMRKAHVMRLVHGQENRIFIDYKIKNLSKQKIQNTKLYIKKKIYLYILRGFRKLVIVFFPVKNTSKLINQQLKNGVKIVN